MKTFVSKLSSILIVLAFLLQSGGPPAPVQAAGTVNLTTIGAAYTQNFDTLASSGTSSATPVGWDFVESGTGANTTYTAGNGGSNTGDTYSFGPTGSSERAFGGLLSSSLVPTIGAGFTNNTGGVITSLQISFYGEQWRIGNTSTARDDRIDFQYSLDATSLNTGTWVDVNSLDFVNIVKTAVTAGPLDGNNPSYRAAISDTITGLNIPNGATFWIRWTDFNATGADDGLAVDDFSLTPLGPGDSAPEVSGTTPADGATNVAIDGNIVITFSEAVDVSGNWFQIACSSSGTRGPAEVTVTGGPTVFTLDPNTDFDNSETCTLTVYAAQVTDQDTNDPPDAMTADFSAGFTTVGAGDSAPEVSSVTPANGATNVAINSNIVITFSEAVDVSGNWFQIACSSSGTRGPAEVAVTGGPTVFTLDPNTDFANNETCTLTVYAAQVTDQDTNDPPDAMTADFSAGFTTAVNICSLPYTHAYEIQGSGPAAAITGAVTTQGVVVGDYETPTGTGQLRGFYLQDLTGDGNPATSDGIFVYTGGTDYVNVGDIVRVSGTAGEYQDQTQIGSLTSVIKCGTGTVAPVDITLPFPSADYPERYEGMLVRFAQTLYVTEHYLLGRFGQVTLSSGGRLIQPTNIALPGAPALAIQAANDLNRIILDDATNLQNPDPIVFGRGGLPLSASNTLRGGDSVTNLTGVMTYTWGGNSASPNAYRIRPINALGGGVPNFVAANPRPATPPAVGGDIKVVSMNLLNYFNTFGTGNCTAGVGGVAVDCRGANDATEFQRQSDKIVNAIVTLNADIIGIVEMENDGYGSASAIQDLVNKLNAATAPGTYAFIDADARTGKINALGTDAIKVGLLYKPASVTPVGNTAVLDTVAFVNGGDSLPRNRVSLLQAFQTTSGARFAVNVNHLKSKGSACDIPDAGDGQGNCNIVRVNAVNELLAWFATDPTGLGDPDLILLGDYNSYAREDPIVALEAAGFTNLALHFGGTGVYSYAFDGQWGTLDYLFASPSLLTQTTGAAEWHINADEPVVLDYNTEYKTAGQIISLYSSEPFRTGDHDPLIAGLTPDSTAPAVFINQAASQSDPATAEPILFEVQFTKPVSGFSAEDVVITGTAPGTKTVIVTGSDAEYTVSVSGMTGTGTVIASIPAGAAQDANGNPSLASASSDNTVAFGRYPTDIVLSATAIAENLPANSLAATLTASDPDTNDTHTFQLVANPAACPSALDNGYFQIPAGTNDLRTGNVFDYETQAVYTLCLRVADSLGFTYDKQVDILITDVNEPPSLALANAITSLPENTDTSSPIKVADLVLTDDALGTNVFSLSDADAAMFEINGLALYLKAGAVLDFETNPVLDVVVSVDDPAVGATPDDSAALSISVTYVDTVAPSIVSILRSSPTEQVVTSGDSVTFRVTFSENVTGVDAADFTLTLLSVPGANATISAVTAVNGSTYDVTVDITGLRNAQNKRDGAIRLDVPATASIEDLAGNPLSGLPYTNGQIYSIVQEQTFGDVDLSYWAWTSIERLYYSGITTGCGSGNYCPETQVTRAQMAIFLERGMRGASFTPQPASGAVFGDVPADYWSAAWIEKLFADQITSGCGNGNYCPENPVTRAQMAVFLLRAKHGSAYTPPAASGTVFTDVPTDYWAAAWVEQLYAEGITSGCGGGNYCPESPVTRAQMAVFLIRAFGLP